MNVVKVEIDQEEATKKYKEYLEAAKKRASRHYSQLKRAYRAASKGYKIIDIYQAFEKTGLKSNGTPKLAVVRADASIVYFHKRDEGAGIFSRHPRVREWQRQEQRSDIELPAQTFPNWVDAQGKPQSQFEWKMGIQTNVPIIPAHLLPDKGLENYYILFEVDKWSPVAKVRDPYLLERVNDNTFIVLAEWDVTEVEAIVMRGPR